MLAGHALRCRVCQRGGAAERRVLLPPLLAGAYRTAVLQPAAAAVAPVCSLGWPCAAAQAGFGPAARSLHLRMPWRAAAGPCLSINALLPAFGLLCAALCHPHHLHRHHHHHRGKWIDWASQEGGGRVVCCGCLLIRQDGAAPRAQQGVSLMLHSPSGCWLVSLSPAAPCLLTAPSHTTRPIPYPWVLPHWPGGDAVLQQHRGAGGRAHLLPTGCLLPHPHVAQGALGGGWAVDMVGQWGPAWAGRQSRGAILFMQVTVGLRSPAASRWSCSCSGAMRYLG